jgi:hypothetical protein
VASHSRTRAQPAGSFAAQAASAAADTTTWESRARHTHHPDQVGARGQRRKELLRRQAGTRGVARTRHRAPGPVGASRVPRRPRRRRPGGGRRPPILSGYLCPRLAQRAWGPARRPSGAG